MEPMKSTDTTNRRESARKGRLMASIVSASTTLEAEVREFARQFPTPNVQRMIALCEAGRIEWADAHKIAQRALGAGLAAVA